MFREVGAWDRVHPSGPVFQAARHSLGFRRIPSFHSRLGTHSFLVDPIV